MAGTDTLLVGNEIHDDTEAIQALLDSGTTTVRLPDPEKYYLISRPLRIHSNTSLVLGRYATIRLADGADCHMLENAEENACNISVIGGIWDFNNKNQSPNPMQIPPESGTVEEAFHYIFYFDLVRNLTIADLTLKDPVIFAVTLSYVEHFTVRGITFDFNYGNPNATNMDGIHLDGGCRFGKISDLKGACYDDLVALNADEGRGGPIEDIEIDGIFCNDCHSAVRLLSRGYWVRRIHISNVYGTFYQYCVGITRFSDDGEIGRFDQIHINDIFASKAPRIPIYGKENSYVYALLWIEGGIQIGNLQVSRFHRREAITSIPTISVLRDAHIDVFSLEHASQENDTDEAFPFMLNEGKIDKLFLRDIQVKNDNILQGEGEISQIFMDEDLSGQLC